MNVPVATLRAAGGRSCRDRRSAASLLAILLFGLLGSARAAGPAADPAARPATAADCQSLLHQFDVAWAAHRDSPHAAEARRSRDAGEGSCAQRHYVEGVHELRRALHDIGLKPVKIVGTPAPH